MRVYTLLLSIALATLSAADDGLFVGTDDQEMEFSVENGKIVMKFPARRIDVTKAIFRHDTEDTAKCWLEVFLPEILDPGDFYVFWIDGKPYENWKVRGGQDPDVGCHWALGFSDPQEGRALLKKIAAAYELDAALVIDRTKPNKAEIETPRKPFD